MPFLLAEILNFQGSTHHIGVGSFSYLSSYDGLPVKNHLPVELRERFKTENQWLESGYVLVAGAVGLEMHPTAVSRTLCTYYLDTQVEER